MAEVQDTAILEALAECYDPEIPMNIVDLGLVYRVETDDTTGHVQITMTLTSLGCPVAGDIIAEIEMRVCQVENVKSCKVVLTFDPPWTSERMSEDAKWELGLV